MGFNRYLWVFAPFNLLDEFRVHGSVLDVIFAVNFEIKIKLN